MLMLGYNETIGQLAMANSGHRHGHVLRKAIDPKLEGQWKKGRLKETWKKQVYERIRYMKKA